MYLVARTATQQDFDSNKTWEQILKWIKIATSVISKLSFPLVLLVLAKLVQATSSSMSSKTMLVVRPTLAIGFFPFSYWTAAEKAFQWFSRCLISTKDILINQVFYPLGTILQANPRLALFISIVIFIGPWIILAPIILILAPLILIQEAYVLVLTALGFSVSGITCGKRMPTFEHNFCYDEDTTPGSLFVYLQTAGATYQVNTAKNPVLLVIRVVAWVVAVYMIVSMAP
ncbi:hypothetical protein ARMGADRAFT_1075764 [Armillaria gallica]|uniref:Uncharacterized protein n=1 Tax=Armillaria gallica TaxID=47427 RepID=A0A2H3E0P4_ARMGA|nr:hypothetical protein ARMGADRAFT_1075764 [Armillaria gallica]